MQAPNPQVRTYVHGTLYSLVSLPSFLDQALRHGLPDMLQAVSATSEDIFQRHIAHILQKMSDAETAQQQETREESQDGDEEADDMDTMEYVDEFHDMEMCSHGAHSPTLHGAR